MPAPFVNTGSDLKSTHRAAALVELISRAQLAEEAIPEATRPNNVQVSYDLESKVVSAAATLPVTTSIGATGTPQLIAEPYMVAPFIPGASDLKSDTLPEAILEMAYRIEESEALMPEATRQNFISVSISDGIASISYSGPVTFTTNPAGETVIATVDYL
jgi:hypothetical protein